MLPKNCIKNITSLLSGAHGRPTPSGKSSGTKQRVTVTHFFVVLLSSHMACSNAFLFKYHYVQIK
ncbi:hypothetical protein Hanom_Chr05g00468211 [Helianthus anomalus]